MALQNSVITRGVLVHKAHMMIKRGDYDDTGRIMKLIQIVENTSGDKAFIHVVNDNIVIGKMALTVIEIYRKFINGVFGYLSGANISDDKNKQLVASLEHINNRLELDPSNEFLYFDRGVVYKELGRFNEAILDFELAATYEHLRSKAYSELGELYTKNDNYESARSAYSNAISLVSNDAKTLIASGRVHLRKGRPYVALGDFEKALRLSPRDHSILSSIGDIYKSLSVYDKAEMYYKLSLAMAPYNTVAYYKLGFLYYSNNKPAMALSSFLSGILYGGDVVEAIGEL